MKKVLIIEDDTFLQGLVSRKLKSESYDVMIASDSDDAFAVLEKGIPDMILLDLLLPKIDGFEILTKIRQDPKFKAIPVIVFSNLSEDTDIKRAQDLGINAFMIKSNFTLDELSERIKGLLG
ncbi:MAG: response regulator [Candidatus Paceibacterota bacterium]|jgi:DNA-binding response OmpR family regulator